MAQKILEQFLLSFFYQGYEASGNDLSELQPPGTSAAEHAHLYP
jgi:hypothetical protein